MLCRRLTRAPVALLIFLCVLSPGLGQSIGITPLADVPDSPLWTSDYVASQHRCLEAETKTRLLHKAATREADATPAMAFYDVGFYDLVLDLDPHTQTLCGTTTLTARVLADSLDAVDLHLRANMAVTGAMSGGTAASSRRAGDVLTVVLDRTYRLAETLQVAVSYSGNPAGEFFGWDVYGGEPLIWSLSEPYGARDWWACKDLNTDKPDSVALHVTVPENLIVASNGLLDDTTVPGPGLKTYHWTERYPIATYLVSLAIHPYEVFTYGYYPAGGGCMPVVSYVVPDQWANAQTGFLVTVDVLEAFAADFGEYPFVKEKFGHAHVPYVGMEHQTLTSIYHDYYNEWLIVHELAHQWFGNMVTCDDFHHVWLNEGLATWCEARWKEVTQGEAAYHEEMAGTRWLGNGTVYVEDPSTLWGIFDVNLSYHKGSWVVHMLRHLMGDAVFFPALRTYLDTYRFGTVTTEQFQAVMEAESGLDLDAFFQQWIYGEGCPWYEYSWNATEVPGGETRLGLRIEQTQLETEVFTMPLDVRVTTTEGVETFVLQNDRALQWYTLYVDGVVLNVEIDPDNWVLCEKEDVWVVEVPPSATVNVHLVGGVPNPFNPVTDIVFVLGREAEVTLAVYDVAGRWVTTLAAGTYPDGEHKVRWNGTHATGRAQASGTYFARLGALGQHQVKSLTLVR